MQTNASMLYEYSLRILCSDLTTDFVRVVFFVFLDSRAHMHLCLRGVAVQWAGGASRGVVPRACFAVLVLFVVLHCFLLYFTFLY